MGFTCCDVSSLGPHRNYINSNTVWPIRGGEWMQWIGFNIYYIYQNQGMMSHTGTRKHWLGMVPAKWKLSGTRRPVQRAYERDPEDWCSDPTEWVKTVGWSELEKSLWSQWWPFPKAINSHDHGSLLDVHPWKCPIRSCCHESFTMALELLYHIYALEDLGIWYCLVMWQHCGLFPL